MNRINLKLASILMLGMLLVLGLLQIDAIGNLHPVSPFHRCINSMGGGLDTRSGFIGCAANNCDRKTR